MMRFGPVSFVLIANLAICSQSSAQALDRQVVRDRIAQWWDSIESIDAKYVRLKSQSGGGPSNYAYQRQELAIASGGRVAVKLTRLSPEGLEDPALDERTDGKKKYQIEEVKQRPGLVDRVIVSNAPGGSDRYLGAMNDLLWIVKPGGLPLHRHLDEGAEFAVDRGSDGKPTYTIKFAYRFKDNVVKCELDPDHDWLPKRVSIGNLTTFTVSKFSLENGHFVPAEGEIEESSRGEVFKSLFRVESIAVNRGVAIARFEGPPPNEGMLMMDQIKGKNYLKGGTAGRKKLESAYPKSEPGANETAPEAEVVIVDRDPERSFVLPVIALSSLVCLCVAAFLRHRAMNGS